jgi:hypothetical protein
MRDDERRLAAARHYESGHRHNEQLDQRCVGIFHDAQHDAVRLLLPPGLVRIVMAVLFAARVLVMMISRGVSMPGAGNLLEEMMHPVGR